VTVSGEPAEDGHRVAFTVQDTGTGIPPEALPHVFDRFLKSSDSGGAGLGLAIAKSLVEAHGGEITAASQRGKGTTMRFVLPAPPP
jgi:signal transduction histidine kinase